MSINPASALNAYKSAAQLVQKQMPKVDEGAVSGAPDFSQMLKSAVDTIGTTGKIADTQALAVAQGQANMLEVVTAVAETEVALETLVSVRDRVIAAYEEIMRMPI
jgi:flagellar hook-basal body complex protein FliE